MKVGYAFSTENEQKLDEQIKQLQESGCEKIYYDLLPTIRNIRPHLQKCLDNVRGGDILIVCSLDSLASTTDKVLQLLDELYGLEVTFISLNDNFNTKGLTGQVLNHITQALGSLKKNVFKARCHEGRQEALERGVKFGRKEGSVNKRNYKKPEQCRLLYENGLPISRIMTLLNIRSYSTVYRYLQQTGAYPNAAKEEVVKPTKLSQKELQKLKKEVYDYSHQLNLF